MGGFYMWPLIRGGLDRDASLLFDSLLDTARQLSVSAGMKRTAICMAVVLLLAGCNRFFSPTSSDDGTTLSGRLTTTDGRAYYPASVALFESSGQHFYQKVDVEGRYRIKWLKPGSYELVLTTGEGAMTHEALRETIEIAPGANARDFVIP